MRLPWKNKTGLPKLLTIFATTLLVSLGLCGVNFMAVVGFVPLVGPGRRAPPTFHDHLVDFISSLLSVTAWLELAGMAIGLLGLLIVGALMVTKGKDGDSL